MRKSNPKVEIEPLMYGGGQEQGLRSGTLPVPLIVGLAEATKIAIGTAMPEKEKSEFKIRGRDLISGLPKDVNLTSNEISEAINPLLVEIASSVQTVFNETPPELVADVMEKGIIISGGSAGLKNIDEFFKRMLGVPAYVAEDSILCVAKGSGIILEHLDVYKRTLLQKR